MSWPEVKKAINSDFLNEGPIDKILINRNPIRGINSRLPYSTSSTLGTILDVSGKGEFYGFFEDDQVGASGSRAARVKITIDGNLAYDVNIRLSGSNYPRHCAAFGMDNFLVKSFLTDGSSIKIPYLGDIAGTVTAGGSQTVQKDREVWLLGTTDFPLNLEFPSTTATATLLYATKSPLKFNQSLKIEGTQNYANTASYYRIKALYRLDA